MGCGSSTVEEYPTKQNNGTATKTHSQTKPEEAKNGNIAATNKPIAIKPVEAKAIQQNKKDVSTKSAPKEKLNFDDFKDIDQHARSVPSSKESTVESLAEYLVSPAKNDVEKVRAFYVWVCDNISYNTDAFFGGTTGSIDHSGEGVLKSRTSVCEGYSRLFLALCEAVGIPCKKLSGYSKGYGYQPGDVISFDKRTNHAWNVVQLSGKWKFIESTWGAGHVDKNRKFVKANTDFYFLTPPQDFIYDHFPYIDNNLEESNKWQLLDNPVSIETYSEMIKPAKEARQLGVKFSHTKTLVKIDKSCKMTVTATDVPFDNFFYDFYDSNGKDHNEAVMVLLETYREAIVTVRPPDTARYTLKLHATLDGKNKTLIDYVIDCGSVEADHQRYPTNLGYYGPKPDFEDRGFKQSGVPAYHVCKNGEFELTLKTSTTPEVLVYLKDASDEDCKKYTMIEQNNESVTIKARLINKGFYKLTLFSKLGEESYNVAYTFLIKNEKPAESKALYPLTYSTTATYQCKLLRPLVRDLPANSEVTIEFFCPFFEAVLANKKVYQKENGDHWTITTTTGESGDISVSGKLPNENSYRTVYVFSIKS